MAVPANDRLDDMAREMEMLRAELAEVRKQQPQHTAIARWRLRRRLLGVSLIMIASWTWAAQASNPIPADIEKRLSALESLIRKGPRDITEVRAPFEVIGSGGKAILQVNDGGAIVMEPKGAQTVIAGGAVAVFDEKGQVAGIETSSEGGGEVVLWNKQGKKVAEISTGGRDGLGSLYLSDSKGENPQTIVGAGAIALFNKKGAQVAGMEALGEGGGEVAVWSRDKKAAVLGTVASGKEGNGYLDLSNAKGVTQALIVGGTVVLSDQKGNPVASMGVEGEDSNATGAVTVMSAMGKDIAKMSADKGTNAGKLNIMNAEGKPVVGLIGGGKGGGTVAVANSTSVPLAEMSVSSDGGRGLFQINRDQKPIAVLTEAVERPGGLLQISNLNGPVANVTVREGGGYLQLTNASGLPTIEAGTLPSGAGTVRAGPFFKCSPLQASTPVLTFGLPDCLVGDESGKNSFGPQRKKK